MDWLSRTKRFTQLNLTIAYQRMWICKESKWKTAFRTPYTHFEYQMMSFDLFNTSTSFQSYINKIMVEKLDIFVII